MTRHDTDRLEAKTRRLFDRWAQWYDAWWARLYSEPLYRRVLTLVKMSIFSPH